MPSTYNGLVGLKTSAGLIDPSGTWPLTPTRDVVGPVAKSVTDIAYAMNALVVPAGPSDLFKGTPYYPNGGAQPGDIGTGLGEGTDPTSKGLTTVTGTRPVDYTKFLSTNALQGKTLLVPSSIVPRPRHGQRVQGVSRARSTTRSTTTSCTSWTSCGPRARPSRSWTCRPR